MEKKTIKKKTKNAQTKSKKVIMKKEQKAKKTSKKGFTLIELLAVIIILGILMIIAIPSVTSYISDSRKNAYVDTAREIIAGARNLVNDGKLEMFDTDATYYIDVNCIKTENGVAKSPYGDFTKAYVGVTYDGKGYDYYWTSVDDAGEGIKGLIKYDNLDINNIESDLTINDISTLRTIGERGKVILITERNNCKKEDEITENLVSINSDGEIDETASNIVCKKATSLHKKTCERESNGCAATVGSGNEITYGTIPNETPKAGDAYDCKVKSNGGYTERFYYIGSDGENSILIYYKNMNDQTKYAYDTSGVNTYGPRTAYQYLPSTSEWNNPRLIAPGIKSIPFVELPLGTSSSPDIIFDYSDKAARMLSYSELKNACGGVNLDTKNSLDNCKFIMENAGTYETENGAQGFWLESPRSYNNAVWGVYGYTQSITSGGGAPNNVYFGVRPVITIKSSSIEK